MYRIFIAVAAALVVLAPPASARAPEFYQLPDIDILNGSVHIDTPPAVPQVGDRLWGNNGSPQCDPVCNPDDPSQQPKPNHTILPGTGEPPSGQFYSWNRCGGGGCFEVQGKSSSNNIYVVKPEDAGSKIQLVVWETNYDCGERVYEGPDAGRQECRWTTVKATALTETIARPVVVAVAPAGLGEAQAGTAYSQTLTATGGTGPYTFAVTGGTLPPGLALSNSGQLTGTPTQGGSYTFTVQASAAGATPGTRTYTVPVRLGLPAALANGVTGVSYNQPLTVAGASGPVTFTVAEGALPEGLSISGAQIVGTPTKQGAFTVTIAAAASGATGSKPYTVEIAYPALTLSPGVLPRAVRGVRYNVELNAAGGTAPYAWALLGSDLPAGVSLKADGRLIGTPRENGENDFDLTLRATDRYGASATIQLRLTYYGPELSLVSTTSISVRAGVAYLKRLRAAGGTRPYTFSLVRGRLPRGLRLSADGTLRGTAVEGDVAHVTIKVADRFGAFAKFRLRVKVAAAAS